MAAPFSSEILPKMWHVFISLQGKDLPGNFISNLTVALKETEIKYYIDPNKVPREDPRALFTKIELSEIALVIFSTMYAESEWCLDELVKIMEQVKKEKLRIIPVFFNVTPEEVKGMKGEFGGKLPGQYIPKWDWDNALQSVPSKTGLNFANFGSEREFLDKIVDSVKRELAISIGEGRREYLNGYFRDLSSVSPNNDIEHPKAPLLDYGMKQRHEIKKDSTFSFQSQREEEMLRSPQIPVLPTAAYSTNDHGITRTQPPPPQYQVFINFRGNEIRTSFVAHLEKAMKLANINVFIDEAEKRGKKLQNLFKRIEESRVAVAIFSERYTESHWCLDELVMMKEQMDQDKLVVIPVFYKLSATACKNLEGAFGDKFRKLTKEYRSEPERIKKWEEALSAVFNNTGLKLSPDSVFVDSIVNHVKIALIETFDEERENSNNPTNVGNKGTLTNKTLIGDREEPDTTPRFGVEQRLKQLEEKLQFGHEQTRFVGVVGMPGIGKTVLAKMLYEKWEHEFKSGMFFPDISKMSEEYGVDWLQKRLMQELLKDIHPNIGYKENAHEFWKDDLLNRKVFIVLDDVSGKKQIKFLLGQRDWIKKGSKIVIISSDESLLQDEVNDSYVVPRLNSRDSLLCFNNDAFGLDYAKGDFIKLSRYFLNYAKGNPLALKALGVELRGKDEAYWEQMIGKLTQCSNKMIQDVLRRRYDDLTCQKDAFLDVACFFQSQNADFVRSMVGSCDSEDEIRDLKDKFLINISGGRVEMHDLLCTFAKELALQALAKDTGLQFRLWNHQDIIYFLKSKLEMKNVFS